MRRILVLGLAALTSMPASVYALGLGNIEQRSGLNQPFDARIPLLKATAEELDSLSVRLADAEQFRRAGVDLPGVLIQLRFEVTQPGKGPDYIRITSRDAIHEPFLNFLIEVSWSKGRLIREYTVLLDPPLYVPTQRLAVQPATAKPTTTAAAPQPTATAATGESWRLREHEVQAGGGRTAGGAETLWSAAEHMRPDESVSIQQMMIALLRANPDAFVQDNINGLKKGYVLKMPERGALDSIARDEALAEVKKHHALWEEYRQRVAAAPAQPAGAAAAGTGAGAATPATGAAVSGEAHLKLLGAKEGGEKGETAATGKGGAEELALTKETLASRERENEELKSQLVESEQLIDTLKSRVALQDDQLADLQKKLAEAAGAAAPAAAVAPPLPAAPAAPAEKPAETAPAPAAPKPEVAPPAAEKPAEKPAEAPPAPAAEAPKKEPPPPQTAAPAPKPQEAPKAQTAPVAAAEKPAAAAGIMDRITAMVGSVVPKSLLDAIPGGVLGLLGGAGILLLVLIALMARVLGRGRGAAAPVVRKMGVAAEGAEETTGSVTQFDEPITETRDGDVMQAAAGKSEFEPNDTTQLAATQDRAPAPPGEDPLAEVNVYLAYERFDEAEKVVKDAVASYPNEHKYKLRLLEVYYSSNNKSAYEAAARQLHDGVGGTGPLWDSAVAMWQEMSPDRALFAEGAEDTTVTATTAGAARQFVDITAGDQLPEAMSNTVTIKPAAPSPGARPAVAPAADERLDFDLGSDETSTAGSDVLDLTAASASAAGEDMLDITAGEPGGDMLDITAAEKSGGDILDLTATAEGGGAAIPGDDLLDVTKTGDIQASDLLPAEHGDLLNVTSPGTADLGGDSELLDITGGGGTVAGADENVIEFDIDGGAGAATGAEPAGAAAESPPDEIEVKAPAADDNLLEFDIGGLSLEGEGDVKVDEAAVAEEVNLDEDTARLFGADAAGLEADTLPMFGDTRPGAAADSGLEIDLAGESLAVGGVKADDKLSTTDAALELAGEELSLDDLTKSLEETLTGLKQSETDSGGLDLSLEGEAPRGEHLQTLEIDSSADADAADAAVEKTVVMPRAPGAELQSAADEVDTKLNLAKAYIELGDRAGARTILDEVVAEGTEAQQQEAHKLLGELG